MADSKGIRINLLAKELGIESKDLLAKLREEEMIDLKTRQPFKNHMATLSVGQVESVREWFTGGGGGTAVQIAPPPDTATKLKKPRTTSRKKKADGDESDGLSDTNDGDNESNETILTDAPPAIGEPSEPALAESVAAPAPVDVPAPPVMTPAEVVAPEPIVTIAPSAPAAPLAPAAIAAPSAPPAPAHPTIGAPSQPAPIRPAYQGGGSPPTQRPTITLGPTRGPGPATMERRPVMKAPQLTELAPATMQGPKIIRIDKADNLPKPGPRPRPGQGEGPAGPGYNVARPITGRGVKVDEDEEEAKKKAAAKAGRTNSARRRGPDGRRGEAMEKLKEYTEADLIARRDAINAASSHRAAVDSHLRKVGARGTHAIAQTAVQKGGAIQIEEPITVKTLSAALGVKVNDIIGKLMRQGIFATINQVLDKDLAGTIGLDYGIELEIAQEETLEEQLVAEFEAREPVSTNLVTRPPVVTILGHVDHGKTSLLDKIRSANVAAGESGGITQHTAAWNVEITGSDGQPKRVTFIDTPGHQAFTAMRARGANMTDVVVLVVAAVEGVMPQTIESINHARAAGVPIIVALNKIDRPDANPDMVLGQLAKENLNPVEWGGDVEVIRTSATTGQGIKDLIEILDYQSQLLDLKADPTASARGTVVEANMDPGLGAVATVLVQDGTLQVGDVILCGPGYGRVRTLLNDRSEMIAEAGPSMPVIVSGLTEMPFAGDKFFVVEDMERARDIAAERSTLSRQSQLSQRNAANLGSIMETLRNTEAKTINLIIKADVQGSVETLVATVTGQNTEEVKVKVIHSGAGPITESDVQLAMATKFKPVDNRVAIIGFHVVAEPAARELAEQNRIDIKTYRVIYEIFDDLKKSLSGMLAPEVREKLHGHVEVRQVFKVSKLGNIGGCFVTDGHVQRGSKIRLIRGGNVITEDLTIESLKRVKDDVKEVKAGLECGIKLSGYDDIKVGDVFEAYIRETHERTL